MRVHLAAALVIALAPAHGLAQTASSTVSAPILVGERAPFSGLLVPELRFVMFLNAETERDELKRKNEAALRTIDKMATAVAEDQPPVEPWYKSPVVTHIGVYVAGVATVLLSALLVKEVNK